jgi:hypothetical protein
VRRPHVGSKAADLLSQVGDQGEEEQIMNEQEQYDRPPRPVTPTPEVHREREVIVTNGGGRGSGASTAIVVLVALVALAIIVFFAFTFLDREGDSIVPDELDITVEVPTPGGSS